jgi:hypothetical protein
MHLSKYLFDSGRTVIASRYRWWDIWGRMLSVGIGTIKIGLVGNSRESHHLSPF